MDTNQITDTAVGGVIGAALLWAVRDGWPFIEKILTRFRQTKKEDKQESRVDIQEAKAEAKEAPERELRVVKDQLAEYKLTQAGIIAKLEEMQSKHHACEVNQAKQEAKIELQQRVIDDQAAMIEELKDQTRHLQEQAGVWRKVQADVQAVKHEQEQQHK